MNQRIKELYSQVMLKVYSDADKNEELFNEFATLIVADIAHFVGTQRNDIPACGFEFENAINHAYLEN